MGVFLLLAVAVFQEVHAGIGMKAPDIQNDVWLNGKPATFAELKGKVVMVEFWTFGCYNCRNVEPYVRQWHRKYKEQGFVVIGVHSPEFSYEKDIEKIKKYLRDHEIDYAVPVDNDFETWNRYGNRYWPALYLIDKKGVIRSVRIGEGGYQDTERLIQRLLAEAS
jgi:thiol-disulfide isomerase/thioredoxin